MYEQYYETTAGKCWVCGDCGAYVLGDYHVCPKYPYHTQLVYLPSQYDTNKLLERIAIALEELVGIELNEDS